MLTGYRSPYALLALVACLTLTGRAQTTVFSETFTNLNNWTTSVSAGDGGASVVSGVAVLTNDASGTTNVAGRVSSVTALSGFSSPFVSTLSSNTGDVVWSFNMRQIRADPSGFAASGYGVGFVLAATGANITSGTGVNGYAVVLGQSGTTDPVRLVSFANGLAGTLTNIIAPVTPTALADVGAEYVSVRVTYTASTSTWTLEGRNDGASAFAAPLTGSLSSLGTATNSTYTGSTMTHMGMFWNYSTAATQTASFDNITVSVTAIPEPSTYAALAGALALVGAVIRRRRSA